MSDGFSLDDADVEDVRLGVRYAGKGTAIVLLHGHPRTRTTWHRAAPQLAGNFFVVCPGLRGYGQSTLPAGAPHHAQSPKPAMARGIIGLLRHFGHDQFAVAGYDRGAPVAFRAAIDYPHAVTRLVVMDALPVTEHLERLNETFVRTPAPARMGEGNHADVRAAVHDPAVAHGRCEDYRAGLRADRAHQEPGRAAGRPIDCPTLLFNATDDDTGIHGGPKTIVAGPSSGAASRSGHHEAGQAPGELARALRDFLLTPAQPARRP
jgi:haloacetate dehalogenase